MKETNPKDRIGSDKLPMHLWPKIASALGCLGLLDGALKYGRSNWRVAGVRYTIYLDAIERHAAKLSEREDIDKDSKLHHLAHILACAGILADAIDTDMIIDDRNYRADSMQSYSESEQQLTAHVKRLKEKYKNKNPKDYSAQDNSTTTEKKSWGTVLWR